MANPEVTRRGSGAVPGAYVLRPGTLVSAAVAVCLARGPSGEREIPIDDFLVSGAGFEAKTVTVGAGAITVQVSRKESNMAEVVITGALMV